MKGVAGGSSGRGFSGHPPPPAGRRRDRDEDLSLFKEMQRSERDRISLLQPVSDEFEPTGNHALYRIASAKKILPGFELIGDGSKNDYDWLKTPPATPLFPSLEMDAAAVQREIPILQPLSRFASNSQGALATNNKPKASARSITPRSSRPMSHLPSEAKNPSRGMQHLSLKTAPLPIDSSNNRRVNSNPMPNSIAKSMNNEKEGSVNFLATNLSNNNSAVNDRKTEPKSRGVSLLGRSTVPSLTPDISDQAPSNLRTDRSLSASRGRPNVYPTITSNAAAKKLEPVVNPRRQSISPSVNRGRTGEQKQDNMKANSRIQSGNGAHILGSKILDKVMNARKSGGNNGEEKEQMMKLRSSRGPKMNDGFGRIITKTSLDTTAMKHSETKRDQAANFRQCPAGVTAHGKTSKAITQKSTTKS